MELHCDFLSEYFMFNFLQNAKNLMVEALE